MNARTTCRRPRYLQLVMRWRVSDFGRSASQRIRASTRAEHTRAKAMSGTGTKKRKWGAPGNQQRDGLDCPGKECSRRMGVREIARIWVHERCQPGLLPSKEGRPYVRVCASFCVRAFFSCVSVRLVEEGWGWDRGCDEHSLYPNGFRKGEHARGMTWHSFTTTCPLFSETRHNCGV